MKFLIIYRHFWPDSPPYASMLRTLGSRLAANGHTVELWCEQPCYKQSDIAKNMPASENIGGIEVRRLPRLPFTTSSSIIRTIDKIIFVPRIMMKALATRIRGTQFDVVWSASIPPVMQGVAARLISRLFSAKFLYHIQDIYPELATHMGYLKTSNPLYKFLSIFERATRQKADRIITLSQDMANTVGALSGHQDNIRIINNFGLESFDKKPQKHENETPIAAPQKSPPQKSEHDPIDFIFAGNLGVFQKLENIVDAMHNIGDENARLILMGEGKALSMLKERSKDAPNIQFLSHRPFEQACIEIGAADIGIVSLEAGVYRFAFPSKTLTYWDLGLPLLVIVEPQSALAQFCVKRNVALVVAPDDVQGLTDAITRLTQDKALRESMAEQVKIVRQEMTLPNILNQWDDMIAQLEDAS